MSQPIDFFAELCHFFKARYPIIHLNTSEYERAYRKLKGIAIKEKYDLYSWNCVDGLLKQELKSNGYLPVGESFTDWESVFQEIDARMKTKDHEIFVLEGLHDFLNEHGLRVWLRKFGEELKYGEGRKHLVLLSPTLDLTPDIEKFITIKDMPLPDREDLRHILKQVEKDAGTNISPDLEVKLVDAALGMTANEADQAYCLSWAKSQFGSKAAEIVMQEKEQIIKKSGILEFFRHNEDLKNVGGLDNLKTWLDRRGAAFSPKAREFHLEEPKGILMLGVPGCGKSLTAKAIAARWNMPLLSLDLGKVFGGIVGSSENNIRTAIRTAEAVAPCVLFIDEIEKGLAGAGGDGSMDSGVGSRVFSTLLTWMQERKKPVFTVATANGIEHLPPELLRKGRFDEIFFVDLPTFAERKEIFSIHLKKRNQDPAKFSLDLLAERSIGFNGAEI